ncbi:MAG: hypothetical protein LBU92_00135 [Prevotellaceae bacterium]|jgi:carboxyl-terminal processing protease|nr:hypothetical protein [Prevotellaceae bacterium]
MGLKISNKKLMLWLSFVAVLLIGVMLGFRLQEDDLQRKYDLLQKWNKLNTVLNLVDREYVDKISRTEIEENVITLSLRELDPHSVYIPASEMQQANEELDGNFDGIGIIFNVMTDTVVVINTIVGGPSERVGVLSGDRIITVNDSVIAGRKISQDSVVTLLRGASGSKVTSGVQR